MFPGEFAQTRHLRGAGESGISGEQWAVESTAQVVEYGVVDGGVGADRVDRIYRDVRLVNRHAVCIGPATQFLE